MTFVAIVAKETTSTVPRIYLAHGVHDRVAFEKSVLDFFVSIPFFVRKRCICFRKKLRKPVTAPSINFETIEAMKHPWVG